MWNFTKKEKKRKEKKRKEHATPWLQCLLKQIIKNKPWLNVIFKHVRKQTLDQCYKGMLENKHWIKY
jgi:hypothetical protein